jgi:cystathionine gamma-lyase
MTENTQGFSSFATDAVHAGQHPDPHSGAVMIPISLSTTFAQKSPGVKYPGNFEYSRSANPTRKAFEDCIAKLENGKYGLAFSSGLGATTTIFNMLQEGDHVICVDDVYGGTQRYIRNVAVKFGISCTFVDFNQDGGKLYENAFTNKTKLVWLETPTNPTLKISDIKRSAEVAHKHGAILVVDNTFMSPYFQRPLDLGADISVHSVTKYINGHSDVVMGVAVMKDDALYAKLKYLQNSLGAIPSPFDCFLALRGVKTLHLRMREAAKSAQVLAEMLEKHEKVEKVLYPGLKSHPNFDIGLKQTTGFSGMITFWVKGGIEQARQFLENVKIFACAESLGGVESLVDHPAIMTHASVPAEERKKLGISDTLIRLSVGVEDVNDLLADLKTALEHVKL